MGGITIPNLPTVLWILTGAVTILLLLVIFGYHIYWRSRERALLEDARDAAGLAARKQTLQADINELREWIRLQKAEIDNITAQREEQNILAARLADLEQQCATKDQENQALRNEVGELRNVSTTLRHLL